MTSTTNASPLLAARAKRIEEVDASYRTKMLKIAAGLSDVIALERGDPDFHTPQHIVDAAKRAIDDNQHHYTPYAGVPALREAISDTLRSENHLDYSVDELIVTAGVQEAIMLSMLGLIDPGDEADDFALMPAEIEKRITPRSKVLILVTPNNPTGAVTPPPVIREIAELVQKHNLILLSDEIYSKLIYPGSEHLSAASLPAMKERTITLNGFSKSHAMTGWRIGYLAGPAPFVELLLEPRHTLSISASTPSQFAALAALKGPQDAVDAMLETYGERRAYLMKELTALGFTYGHPGGGFCLYTNVSHTGMAASVFCEELLRQTGLLVFPGMLFGDEDDRYIRITFLQPIERLQEAVAQLTSFLST
ncbi:aminotransferase class I/II-fold pyridoxal phosphate-dependent enzyme [Chloroflexi bacterium TSY]|nr:aminotransferase class I/II-fold pyridoxal phosphate-dependent enzyme [Chloroflexi bacterium TSY]